MCLRGHRAPLGLQRTDTLRLARDAVLAGHELCCLRYRHAGFGSPGEDCWVGFLRRPFHVGVMHDGNVVLSVGDYEVPSAPIGLAAVAMAIRPDGHQESMVCPGTSAGSPAAGAFDGVADGVRH